MDDEDMQAFQIFLGVLCVFLFATYMTWSQFSYWAFAERAEARVTNVTEVEVGTSGSRRTRLLGGGRTVTKKAVEFSYENADGRKVREREDFPISSEFKRGDTFEVRYFPDDENSARVAGTDSWLWPVVFFGALIAMAAAVWNIAKEADQPIAVRR